MMFLPRLLQYSMLLLCLALLPACGAKEVPVAESDEAQPGPAAPADEATPPAPRGEPVWPVYHGNAALTGVTHAVLPDELELLWRHRVDERIANPPISDGERWYIAALSGTVFALDMDGQELWSVQLWAGEGPNGQPRKATVDSPPVYLDGAVYIATARGVLHALDAATGEERWALETDGTFLGTPSFGTLPGPDARQVVYAMSQSDGDVYCIDPVDGELLWIAPGPERCDGSPAVYEDSIVFGSCAAALHVVSAADGAHERDIEIDDGSEIAAGVAIVDGTVFVGTRSGMFLAADLASGRILWTNEDCEDEIFTTPAVTDALVLFGARDGTVYCLDREDGTLRWKHEAGRDPTSVVVADGKAIFAADGTLHMLRLETGEPIWSRNVADDISAPAILDNLLVVTGRDGAVTAFGPPQAEEE